jgi:hypothetical protein
LLLIVATVARCLDRGNIDFCHLHHGVEGAFGGGGIGVNDRLG